MKWVYVFSTGEISEVEVSEELGAVLKDMEHKEKLDRRRHAHWNTPLSAFNDGEDIFADDHDVLGDVLRRCDVGALHAAMEQLQPSQRKLLRKVYWQGIPIARKRGAGAISTAFRGGRT